MVLDFLSFLSRKVFGVVLGAVVGFAADAV